MSSERNAHNDFGKHEESPTLSQNFMNVGPLRLKWDRRFYPPAVNSAFSFVARRRKQRSVNGAQPNFAKRKEVNGADTSRIRWHHIVNVNAVIKIG